MNIFALIFITIIILIQTEIISARAKPKPVEPKDTIQVVVESVITPIEENKLRPVKLEKTLLDSATLCLYLAEKCIEFNEYDVASIHLFFAFTYYYHSVPDSFNFESKATLDSIYNRVVTTHFVLMKNQSLYQLQEHQEYLQELHKSLHRFRNDSTIISFMTSLSSNHIDENEQLEKIKQLYKSIEEHRNKKPIKPELQSVPIVHNDRVQTKINFFKNSEKGRKQFDIYLSRMAHMDPRIVPILREEGIPEELICLAIAESALRYDAISKAKATGVFQFMKGTALIYGLKVSAWYDERYNVEKSARAASLYLRKLYEEDFQDWYLTMAAYNAGEGRIRRSSNNKIGVNYWNFKRGRGINKIPKETFNYVPTIIAIMDIYKNLDVYGFKKPELVKHHPSEEVLIRGLVGFDVIANYLNIQISDFKHLNPEYINNMTDPNTSLNTIRVPLGMGKMIKSILDTLSDTSKIYWVTYSSKKPIKLDEIAKKYQISSDAVYEFDSNKTAFSRNRFIVGRQIKFPITLATSNQLHLSSSTSYEELVLNNEINSQKSSKKKQKIAIQEKKVDETTKADSNSNKTIKVIKVKKGDSLYSISKFYNISVDELAKLNNINKRTTIHPGQTLKVLAVN